MTSRTILHYIRPVKVYLSEKSAHNNFWKFAYRIKESFPFNIFLDEGSLLYILASYRSAKEHINENNITHIYSSYRPYADHLICYLLKRQFPDLFWIADFRDPHVDSNRKNVLFPALQHWVNRFILKRANRVVTVSNGLSKYLRQYHDNVVVLRNGIGAHYNPVLWHDARLKNKFLITYTGTLYEKTKHYSVVPYYSGLIG